MVDIESSIQAYTNLFLLTLFTFVTEHLYAPSGTCLLLFILFSSLYDGARTRTSYKSTGKAGVGNSISICSVYRHEQKNSRSVNVSITRSQSPIPNTRKRRLRNCPKRDGRLKREPNSCAASTTARSHVTYSHNVTEMQPR